MKKVLMLVIVNISLFLNIGVLACGEIAELTSDIGTVTKTNQSNFLITVPEGTTKVKLSAKTEYDWVENYGPREVSTNNKVDLKVDGNKCGYGIYTYFVTFKHVSNLIAENTPSEGDNQTPNTNGNETTTEGEGNNEGVAPGENQADLKLSSLIISGYDLIFNKDIKTYNLDVAGNVTSLDITATPELEGVTVSISENAKNLQEGINKVIVTLINAEGATDTYEINVTKAKELSSNNYLASITVSGYPLNFDPSETSYSLEIKKETMLSINVVTESQLATYEIIGNSALSDGSTITIKVTAEDGSTKDYTIKIIKKFNIMDYWMYIAVAGLILLLVILLIINKKMKNKKKMGPEVIEGQSATAGTIAETIPQNVEPVVTQAPQVAQNAGQIQYIEPTNVTPEAQPVNQVEQVQPTVAVQPVVEQSAPVNLAQPTAPQSNPTQESQTEVFKL